MNSDKQEKQPPVPISIDHNGTTYTGLARPLLHSTDQNIAMNYDVFLDQNIHGTLRFDDKDHYSMENCPDKELLDKLAKTIMEWNDQKKDR